MYVRCLGSRWNLKAWITLVAVFRDGAKLVESHDHFLDALAWRSDRESSEVLMIGRWQDRDTLTAHLRSADPRTSHSRTSPTLKAALTLRRLEEMHTNDVVAQ